MAKGKAKRKARPKNAKKAPKLDVRLDNRLDNGTTTDPGVSEELSPIEAIEVDISSFDDPSAVRRSERVRLDERVEVRGLFGGGDTIARDASLHGIFVETAYLLEVGDPVAVSFSLEDGGRLQVSGRVRWVTPFGGLKDARPGMGIELVALRPDARERLSALLYKRARAQ